MMLLMIGAKQNNEPYSLFYVFVLEIKGLVFVNFQLSENGQPIMSVVVTE
jgi:hypothetical protein